MYPSHVVNKKAVIPGLQSVLTNSFSLSFMQMASKILQLSNKDMFK